MGRSRSDEARKEWLQRKQQQSDDSPSTAGKRAVYDEARQENERIHVHFMCKCCACAQEFAICGLPCFVICPGCHLVLNQIRFT